MGFCSQRLDVAIGSLAGRRAMRLLRGPMCWVLPVILLQPAVALAQSSPHQGAVAPRPGLQVRQLADEGDYESAIALAEQQISSGVLEPSWKSYVCKWQLDSLRLPQARACIDDLIAHPRLLEPSNPFDVKAANHRLPALKTRLEELERSLSVVAAAAARPEPELRGAITVLNEQAELRPRLLLTLGRAYLSLARPELAIEVLGKYLSRSPRAPAELRAEAEASLRQAEAQLAARRLAESQKQAAPAGSEKTKNSPRRLWPLWTALGAVVVATGIGLTLGLTPRPHDDVIW